MGHHLPALLQDERLDLFCDKCIVGGLTLSAALQWLSEAERRGLVNPYWVGSELWVCRTTRAEVPAGTVKITIGFGETPTMEAL